MTARAHTTAPAKRQRQLTIVSGIQRSSVGHWTPQFGGRKVSIATTSTHSTVTTTVDTTQRPHTSAALCSSHRSTIRFGPLRLYRGQFLPGEGQQPATRYERNSDLLKSRVPGSSETRSRALPVIVNLV